MPTIYDAYGRPVDLRALRQELAGPSLTSVRQVWADHPSSGLTPERLTRLLRASEEGDPQAYLALAEDMEEKDLNYRSQLQTRKMAVAGLPLMVEAASDSKEDVADADLVREVLAQEWVEDSLLDMLDALGKGYSVLEIMWDTSASQWMPQELRWRRPEWFIPDQVDGETILLREGGIPVPLAPYKFIVHKPKLKSGLPLRGGLARAAAWSYLFGNYALKDWVGFLELFGQPFRVGKYPSGMDKDGLGREQIDILRSAVAGLGTDACAVFPDNMAIDIIDAGAKTGRSDLYEKLLRYLDERVTVAILGQTLTSGQTRGGGGSHALGLVHNQVRMDLRKSDARQASGALCRQLVRAVVDLNRGPRKRYPRAILHVAEPEDLTALAQNLGVLVPLGLRVEASVVRDKYGLPDPPKGKDVELLQPPTAAAPPAAPRQAPPEPPAAAAAHTRSCPHCAAHAQGGGWVGEDTDPADLLMDQLDEATAGAMAALLEPVRRLVLGAQSLEEIRDGLLELYPGMETTDFAEILTQAMTAAVMAGRFEVARGR